MRLPNMISDNTLRRPRALFAIGLVTLCMTLILSYERIKHSSFGLFEELVPASANLNQLEPLTEQEIAEYRELFDKLAPMSYGTATRPKMDTMPKRMVADLPAEFVPAVTANVGSAGRTGARRLVIVGDVHGQKKALEALLAKVGFDNDGGDHLVLVGDLVNKGPDSAGVVDLAMSLGAHAVRGNHEDRVLLAHAAMKKQAAAPRAVIPDVGGVASALETFQLREGEEADQTAAMQAYAEGEAKLSKGDQRDRETARSLSAAQIEWLSNLPLVLRVGSVPRGGAVPVDALADLDVRSSSDDEDGEVDIEGKRRPGLLDNIVVCHAGLVPGLPLEDQDPWAVMNMRTISYPADELRRDAVRDYLKEVAFNGGGRGALSAQQGVDDVVVEREMGRIAAAEGLEVGHEVGETALPSSGRKGTYWYEEWSRFQEKLARKLARKGKNKGKGKKSGRDEVTTVVYGHDAKSGLRVPREYGRGKKGYTFGLDSGCVYGKKLSALVIEVKAGGAAYEIVQVKCDKAAEAKED